MRHRPPNRRPPRAVPTWTALASVVLLAAMLLAACGGEDEQAPLEAGASMRLEVLVFNVEYGGGADTDEAVKRVDADVVGVLESYNRLPEIAEATGYPYYNTSLQILSKYPILEPSGGDGQYAFIEVQPGFAVVLCNIHLDYVKYGPKLLRNGVPVDEVIASEDEVRTSALAGQLEVLPALAGQGYPVFLTGDFNQPSSLDYTEDTAEIHPDVEVPVAWPVSEALFEVGFRDTYREIHPDPVKVPGITHEGAGDRIDFIYASGPAETLESELIGEKGGPDVTIGVDPWTSDHRAVVSTFDITPLSLPTTVAVDARLLDVGDPVTATYNAPGSGGGEVAIVPAGGEPGSAVQAQEAPGEKGELTFDTSDLDPGGHDVVLTSDGDEVARVGIWVRAPDAEVQVTTDEEAYAVGDPIVVSWTGGPANRWDWIGVYEAKAADPKIDYYLIWAYTGQHASGTVPPSVVGSVTMGESTQGRPWPLPPGDYVVHYLLTDRYRSAASASFTITG